MGFKAAVKQGLTSTLCRLTGRPAVFLSPEAAGGLLTVSAPYRAAGDELSFEVVCPGPGRLSLELLGYRGHFPTQPLWRSPDFAAEGPCRLVLDLASGELTLSGRPLGTLPTPLPRRFAVDWQFVPAAGPALRRRTGHYRPSEGDEVGEEYFTGDNYVDHEAQSAHEGEEIAGWLRRFGAAGPVLEVGCATGGALAALTEAGFDSYGVDFSPWAVERARERLGAGRAFLCDLDREPLPLEIAARAPFGALVLWSVLEHFADPFATLAQLTKRAAPGAVLLIQTTNHQSLTSRLFGPDWEGYFDRTHRGVERVHAESLRRELPRLGWRILHWESHLLWTASADPTHVTLREWYAADARFRQLLAERDLGDLVLLVARREEA